MIRRTSSFSGLVGPISAASTRPLLSSAPRHYSSSVRCLHGGGSFDSSDKSLSEAENEIAKAVLDLRAAIDQGEYEAGKEAAETCLELTRSFYGDKPHPATASALNNLGLCLKHLGKYEDAEKHYEAALKTYKDCVGPDHLSTAAAYLNLGLLQLSMASRPGIKGMVKMNLVDSARSNLEQAHSIRAKATGSMEHPLTLSVLLHVAAAARMQRRFKEAENILTDTVAALRKRDEQAAAAAGQKLTMGSLSVATGLNNQGFLYKEVASSLSAGAGPQQDGERKRYWALSAAAYSEALTIREARLGPKHPDTIATLHNMAELKYSAGDEDGANKIRATILERIGKGAGVEDLKEDVEGKAGRQLR